MLSKGKLRKSIIKTLRSITPLRRSQQSNAILHSLVQLPIFGKANPVALFLSMDTEVDTRPLLDNCLRSNKLTVVPRIVSKQEFEWVKIDSSKAIDALPKDHWGIPIPEWTDSTRMVFHPDYTPEMVIVPGVAFDSRCRRLGHGKGFYGKQFARC